jgi:hypothetical protein
LEDPNEILKNAEVGIIGHIKVLERDTIELSNDSSAGKYLRETYQIIPEKYLKGKLGTDTIYYDIKWEIFFRDSSLGLPIVSFLNSKVKYIIILHQDEIGIKILWYGRTDSYEIINGKIELRGLPLFNKRFDIGN